ncbi:MAG: holo-ACP synthase [Candidatus Puniceispirillaceae bacterium]
MILGLGHDICDMRRIAKIRARFGARFEAQILTQAELAEMQSRQPARQDAYLALRFAAKEAVYKAFAKLDQSGLCWQDCEVISGGGAPSCHLTGRAGAILANSLPAGMEPDIHLSLSDEYPYASAMVVFSMRPQVNET